MGDRPSCTLISPLAYFSSAHLDGVVPSLKHINSVRDGWLLPPKTRTLRMPMKEDTICLL